MSWKDYFAFNKRQRNGILVLLVLIAGSIVYLIVSDLLPPGKAEIDFSSFRADMAKVKFKKTDSVQVTKQTDSGSKLQAISIVSAPLELNSADSAAFMQFPLVSRKVARTIIRFRDALGGYYSKAQLLEVYGMDSACYNSIAAIVTLDVSKVEKLNINKAPEKELTHHPYLHKKLAKAIVEYRKKNGGFKSVKEIMNVDGIDATLYAKLSPYLTLE